MVTILDTVIPGKPPGINSMYINIPGRGRILAPNARKWKDIIGLETKVRAIEGYEQYVTSDLRLEIIWFWKELYRSDLDNPVKLVQDAVCQALGYNDKRVIELSVTKLKSKDNRFAILLTTL
jgi:Holliday junction resolvase RusA-like endonuclease